MTEALRTSLLTACAYAKVFTEAADAELRGGPSLPRRDAASQLEFALEVVRDETLCECGHDIFWHEGLHGGKCLVSGCGCQRYKEAV